MPIFLSKVGRVDAVESQGARNENQNVPRRGDAAADTNLFSSFRCKLWPYKVGYATSKAEPDVYAHRNCFFARATGRTSGRAKKTKRKKERKNKSQDTEREMEKEHGDDKDKRQRTERRRQRQREWKGEVWSEATEFASLGGKLPSAIPTAHLQRKTIRSVDVDLNLAAESGQHPVESCSCKQRRMFSGGVHGSPRDRRNDSRGVEEPRNGKGESEMAEDAHAQTWRRIGISFVPTRGVH